MLLRKLLDAAVAQPPPTEPVMRRLPQVDETALSLLIDSADVFKP